MVRVNCRTDLNRLPAPRKLPATVTQPIIFHIPGGTPWNETYNVRPIQFQKTVKLNIFYFILFLLFLLFYFLFIYYKYWEKMKHVIYLFIYFIFITLDFIFFLHLFHFYECVLCSSCTILVSIIILVSAEYRSVSLWVQGRTPRVSFDRLSHSL